MVLVRRGTRTTSARLDAGQMWHEGAHEVRLARHSAAGRAWSCAERATRAAAARGRAINVGRGDSAGAAHGRRLRSRAEACGGPAMGRGVQPEGGQDGPPGWRLGWVLLC